MNTPREPTADECTQHADIGGGWTAIWYPQMGGYVGKAAVHVGNEPIQRGDGWREGGCIEVFVWHDGEFPFADGDIDGWSELPKKPAHLHHCEAEQFIRFGQSLVAIQERRLK